MSNTKQNPPAAPASWADVEVVKVERAAVAAAKRVVHEAVHALVRRSRDESARLTVPIPQGETFDTAKAMLQQAGREASPQSTVRVKPAVVVDAEEGTWTEPGDGETATHISFVAGPKVGASKNDEDGKPADPANVPADQSTTTPPADSVPPNHA